MFPKTVFTDETKLQRKTLSSKTQQEADRFTWESVHEMAQLASICQGLVKQFMHRKPIQMFQHSYSSPTPNKKNHTSSQNTPHSLIGKYTSKSGYSSQFSQFPI